MNSIKRGKNFRIKNIRIFLCNFQLGEPVSISLQKLPQTLYSSSEASRSQSRSSSDGRSTKSPSGAFLVFTLETRPFTASSSSCSGGWRRLTCFWSRRSLAYSLWHSVHCRSEDGLPPPALLLLLLLFPFRLVK